jgi:hypothetical protein
MLNEIGRRIDDPGDKDLVLRNFLVAQILPLMSVPGIGRFKRQAGRSRPHRDIKGLGQRDVVGVRAFVIAPAEVHAHRFRRNIGRRMIECWNISLGNT